jgi:hypothetical protein
MRYLILFFSMFFFISCRECHVAIANNSNKNFDSLIFKLNNYKKTITSFSSKSLVTLNIPLSKINASHDVFYEFVFYEKGDIVLKEYKFSNDLGYVPDEAKFELTDSMVLKQAK